MFNKKEKENIIKEMNILTQLNHPVIQKFIGYNSNDFNHHRKSVLLYEYSINLLFGLNIFDGSYFSEQKRAIPSL